MEKYQFITTKATTQFSTKHIIFYYRTENTNIIYNQILSHYVFNYLKNIYKNIQIKNELKDISDSIIFYIDNVFEKEQLEILENNNNILILHLVDQYTTNLIDWINYFSLVIISNKSLLEYLYEELNYIGETIFIPIPIYPYYKKQISYQIEFNIDNFLKATTISSNTLICANIFNGEFDKYFSNYLMVTSAYYGLNCVVNRCNQSESIFGKDYRGYFNTMDELSDLINNYNHNVKIDLTQYKLEYIVNKYYEAIDYCSQLLDVILSINEKQSESKNRMCLYTAVFGDYDKFYDIKLPEKNIDYYYLTDNINKQSENYKFIKCPLIQNNFTVSNRFYKILDHRFFKNYEWTIFIDGNIEVKSSNIYNLCIEYTKNNNLAVHVHPHYQSLVQELTIIIRKNLYSQDRNLLMKQLARYQKDNFPVEFPLTWNTVIFRKKSDEIKKLSFQWYSEFLKFCRRDQASFMYLIWKNKISIGIIDVSKDLLYEILEIDGVYKKMNIESIKTLSNKVYTDFKNSNSDQQKHLLDLYKKCNRNIPMQEFIKEMLFTKLIANKKVLIYNINNNFFRHEGH